MARDKLALEKFKFMIDTFVLLENESKIQERKEEEKKYGKMEYFVLCDTSVVCSVSPDKNGIRCI